ncbi:hypothetical protein A9G35_07765 [Gilliamella sp. Choc5-1]|uniref:hypothetical protein n=1 Tax=Gilliamella sp. Choc5-1 TaxID=3120238 RepID=UPI00080E9FA5|nr:hypothetical protein [Gilliamella apicola]OCG44718.1 hypothetical protein A9G35_07765 [Gilliamella apicola]
MYSGIVLYNTENISPNIALEFAETLFSALNTPITEASYVKPVIRKAYSDFKFAKISLKKLKRKINLEEVIAFDLLNELDNICRLQFVYNTDKFGRTNNIYILYDNKLDHDGSILELMKNFARQNYFAYGIKYSKCKSTNNATEYAGGFNFATIYPYEKYHFDEKKLDGNKRLRMIYTANIINCYHLEIGVDNTTLKDWILSNISHGTLEKLSDKLWLWQGPENELDNINYFLGQLGLLISWELPTPEPEKPRRRLP